MFSSFNSIGESELKTFINLVPDFGQNDSCTVKTIKKNFVIPAERSLKVPCRVNTGPLLKRVPVMFEPSEIGDLPHGLNVQQTVLSVSPQTSRIHLDIFNSTNHDIFLPNRTELGRLELVRTVTPLEVKLREPPENDSKDSETSMNSPDKVSVSVDSIKTEQSQQQSPDLHHIISDTDLSDLNLEQAQLAGKMLLEELDSFSISDSDVGRAEGLQMEINLKNNTPVQKSYQSIPKPLHSDVKAYIKDLLNQGFITKSKSSYSSPVVCVGKRDNSLRLCVLIFGL